MFQDIDDTIERDGFTLRARIEHDSDTGAPQAVIVSPPMTPCAREAAPDLLAAAPDLLAACEAAAQLLLNDPNRVRDGWMTDIIRQLRKAIAKANGAAAVEQEFPSLSLDNMSRETPWENEQ